MTCKPKLKHAETFLLVKPIFLNYRRFYRTTYQYSTSECFNIHKYNHMNGLFICMAYKEVMLQAFL